ncbi:hypothetical protein BV25DRAFT_938717 [Artomyces pyxidatus]|uniref:Uncharacterized protein n=1 Tax=Artomyces pyxidatus TaxID=48021 RepID=A0ACB8SVN4_9AGAM|nr:hypothetical protein BV25DRAFT_938717 [Artomyces pyxidatus]
MWHQSRRDRGYIDCCIAKRWRTRAALPPTYVDPGAKSNGAVAGTRSKQWQVQTCYLRNIDETAAAELSVDLFRDTEAGIRTPKTTDSDEDQSRAGDTYVSRASGSFSLFIVSRSPPPPPLIECCQMSTAEHVVPRDLPDAGAVLTALIVLAVIFFIAVPLWLLVRRARRKDGLEDKVVSPQTLEVPTPPVSSMSSSSSPVDSPPMYPAAHPSTGLLPPQHISGSRKPCKCQGCRRLRSFAFGQHHFDGNGGGGGYVSRPLSPITEARSDETICTAHIPLTRTRPRDALPALSLKPTAKDPLVLAPRGVLIGRSQMSLGQGGVLPTLGDDHLLQARKPGSLYPVQPVSVDAYDMWEGSRSLESSASSAAASAAIGYAFPIPVVQQTSPVWDELPSFSPTISLVPTSTPPLHSTSLDMNVSHERSIDSGNDKASSHLWFADEDWVYSDVPYSGLDHQTVVSTSPAFQFSGLILDTPDDGERRTNVEMSLGEEVVKKGDEDRVAIVA